MVGPRLVAAAAFMAVLVGTAEARSKAQARHFRVDHPCPASGRVKGPCPNFVIDHVVPLCAGGLDAPINMQWQTTIAAKEKDRLEMQECRQIRRSRLSR